MTVTPSDPKKNQPSESSTSSTPTPPTSENPTTNAPAGIDADDLLTANERKREKDDKSRSEIAVEREDQELRVIALNLASHVEYADVDAYLAGAHKVLEFLQGNQNGA